MAKGEILVSSGLACTQKETIDPVVAVLEETADQSLEPAREQTAIRDMTDSIKKKRKRKKKKQSTESLPVAETIKIETARASKPIKTSDTKGKKRIYSHGSIGHQLGIGEENKNKKIPKTKAERTEKYLD